MPVKIYKAHVSKEEDRDGKFQSLEKSFKYARTSKPDPSMMSREDITTWIKFYPKMLFFPNSLSHFEPHIRHSMIIELIPLTPVEDTMLWVQHLAHEFFAFYGGNMAHYKLPKGWDTFTRLIWSRIESPADKVTVTQLLRPYLNREYVIVPFVKIYPEFVLEMGNYFRKNAVLLAWKTALNYEPRLIHLLPETLNSKWKTEILAHFEMISIQSLTHPKFLFFHCQLQQEEDDVLLSILTAFNKPQLFPSNIQELIVRGFLGLTFNHCPEPRGYVRWNTFTLGNTLARHKTFKKQKTKA